MGLMLVKELSEAIKDRNKDDLATLDFLCFYVSAHNVYYVKCIG
jgi:hypothetical protein